MADTEEDAVKDALKHFLATPTDNPYTLLDLPSGPASTSTEIRKAWRSTSLRYHPDKVRAKGAVDEDTANKQFILRSEAYEVLRRPHLKEQYDNSLRAREQKLQRDAQLTGKRKAMKEELERREGAGKRRRVEVDEEAKELERLRLDGQKRRRERAERLMREAREEEERAAKEEEEGAVLEKQYGGGDKHGLGHSRSRDIDRVVKLRFAQEERTAHLTRERVQEMFRCFGEVQSVMLSEKKIKVDGEKHRRLFVLVSVIYESVVGAHAAVSKFPETVQAQGGDWALFDEGPSWASGSEPQYLSANLQQPGQTNGTTSAPIPTTNGSETDDLDIMFIQLGKAEKSRKEAEKRRQDDEAAAADSRDGANAPDAARAMPKFASFKARAAAANGAGANEENRREAEKKRLEEELRRKEEEEDLEAAGD